MSDIEIWGDDEESVVWPPVPPPGISWPWLVTVPDYVHYTNGQQPVIETWLQGSRSPGDHKWIVCFKRCKNRFCIFQPEGDFPRDRTDCKFKLVEHFHMILETYLKDHTFDMTVRGFYGEESERIWNSENIDQFNGWMKRLFPERELKEKWGLVPEYLEFED